MVLPISGRCPAYIDALAEGSAESEKTEIRMRNRRMCKIKSACGNERRTGETVSGLMTLSIESENVTDVEPERLTEVDRKI